MSIFKQQREMVKKEILEKSVSLFKEKGYSSISIEQIAKETGIAKGTFYNYFTTKKDILILWADQEFSKIAFQNIEYHNFTMQNNLYRLVEILVEAIKVEGNLFTSFFEEIILTSPRKELENRFDFLSIFSKAIKSSSDSESIGDNFNEKMNVFNNAMFLGLTEWLKRENTVDGLEQYLKMIVDICLFGMVSR